MIYDKKEQVCVDITTHPYFRDYEVAVNTDGFILMLQRGEVVCSADMDRFQADPVEIFDLSTGKAVDTATHPYFKDYEVASGKNHILMLQYGSVMCSADSALYGVRQKNSLDLKGSGLLPSEQDVYRYISSYIMEHRYAPTYEEILKNCKLHSKSTISLYIRKMLTLGILESDAPGSSRVLRLPMPA
nr:hypothetical protein [uncultured Blautia sp.]